MRWIKTLLVFLILTVSAATAYAQRNVFLEVGGSGGLGSLNYEYWLPQHKGQQVTFDDGTPNATKAYSHWCYTLRGGLGLSPIDKNNGWVVVLPMMFNVVYGNIRGDHRFEFGGGIAPSFTTTFGGAYIKSPLMVGYRYTPFKKRYFIRADYTPIVGWLVDFQWQHWAGVSIGYNLGGKNEN